MYQNLKKLCKSIEEKKFKELIKFLIQTIMGNSEAIHVLKTKLKDKIREFNYKKIDSLSITISKKNKNNHLSKRIKVYSKKLSIREEKDIF